MGGFITYMIRTVMARLVRYDAERKIWRRLILMPMKAYIAPDIIRRVPATLKAGVIMGVRGRRFGVAVAMNSFEYQLYSSWFLELAWETTYN